MKKHRKTAFIVLLGSFGLAAVISYMTQNEYMNAALRPCIVLLAFFSFYFYVKPMKEYWNGRRLVLTALSIWLFMDVLALFRFFMPFSWSENYWVFDGIEIILGVMVRILLYISVLLVYHYLTRQLHPFLMISDIFITLACVSTAVWMIFFRGETYPLKDERFGRLLQGDIAELTSVFYMIMSLLTLGILMVSSFYYTGRKITMGYQLLLVSVTIISSADLFLSFVSMNSLDKRQIAMLYDIAFFLIIVGSLIYENSSVNEKFFDRKLDHIPTSWLNALYLLIYPALIILTVGFHSAVLLYILLIIFYCYSILYTKQIRKVDYLLERERNYSEKLQLYSNVLEQAPMSVVIADVDGKVQYVNPYFQRTTGFLAEDIIGEQPYYVLENAEMNQQYQEVWKSISQGKEWSGDLISKNKEGEDYEERAIILPIKDKDEKITHFVSIKQNISEEKRIKNQLSNQSYFTSQLLDVIPGAIFYTSLDDYFLGGNKECRRIFGINTEELRGVKLSKTFFMLGERYQKYLRMKEESVKSKSISIRQISVLAEDCTERTALFSLCPFYLSDNSIGGFLGIMTDITDLKQNEADLEEALKKAKEAATAKTTFLANMSHEIRTPMNAILGMTYLTMKTDLNQKQMDYIIKIQNAASSLLGIINEILDFSKFESGKLEMEQTEFYMETVLSNAIDLFVPKAFEKQLEFLYHISNDLPKTLIGDPLRLGQIITNLVSNAVKFTERGEIEIDVSCEQQYAGRIKLRISVRDTGIGIVQSSKEKIFEAFTQMDSSTTRKYGGTGLGLTICQRLVEMMDGTLWVESEYGKGSTFTFTAWFDYKDDRIQSANIPVQLEGKRALVVDDNRAAGKILKEYLEVLGMAVEVTESGEEAIARMLNTAKSQQYTMVFLDWQMPGLSGMETAEKIKTSSVILGDPLLFIVAGNNIGELSSQPQASYVDGYLSKPINQQTLKDMLLKVYKTYEAASSSVKSADNDVYDLSGKHILLVEDNEINRQIAYELLTQHGIDVELAQNGLEALEAVSQAMNKRPFQLVLMDIQMPVMDGFTATEKIHELDENLPVIAMTARTMEDEKEKCYLAGMNDHIAKPIDPFYMFYTIAKWVRSESN